MTRNNHIDSKEVTEVKFESPAALSADGKRKLGDHKMGCAIAVNKTNVKIVGTISFGEANIFIIAGKSGNNKIAVRTNKRDESPIKDLMNFLAS